VRQPNHQVARQLIAQANVPVAAPSANLFGRISPTTAQHVADQLGERIDYILDGGPCRVGVESTVVTVENNRIIVLRPGGVTMEDLRQVSADVEFDDSDGTEKEHASPGRTLQHYAPGTKLVIRDTPEIRPEEAHLKVGLLAQGGDQHSDFAVVEQLTADMTQAASRFFAALRRLDEAGLDLIVSTAFPQKGLGIALNDRLKRAASETDTF
jgi:L-threonylcarbamoyladenylate synthase